MSAELGQVSQERLSGLKICWAEKGQEAFSQQRGQQVPRTQDRNNIVGLLARGRHSASQNLSCQMAAVCVQVRASVTLTPHVGLFSIACTAFFMLPPGLPPWRLSICQLL